MKVVADTGVLVEVLGCSKLGEKFIQPVDSGKLEPVITNFTLIELSHTICRQYD